MQPDLLIEKALKCLQSAVVDFGGVSFSYLAGSLIEGYGNKTSDADVFVVAEEGVQFRSSDTYGNVSTIIDGVHALNLIEEGIRYDFEAITLKQLREAVEIVNSFDIESEKHLVRMSSSKYDLLHRLRHSVGLMGIENYEQFRSGVNWEKFQLYRVGCLLEDYFNLKEDLQGALGSRDYGTAFFLARGLLSLILRAQAALVGCTNPSEKWTYRVLIQSFPRLGLDADAEIRSYFDLMTRPFAELTARQYCLEVLSRCEQINDRVQTQIRLPKTLVEGVEKNQEVVT